jgi:hypothetical protein
LSWSLWKQAIQWRGLLAGVFLFLLAFPVLIIGAFLYAGYQWQGPRGIEDARRSKPKQVEGPPRLIPLNSKRSQKLATETEPPTVKREKKGFLPFLQKDEDAPAWCKEMYRILMTIWPSQNLTRENFEGLFGGPKFYYKYIGGRKGQPGTWDNWGVIAKTGRNGSWEFCADLPEILAKDPTLCRYAERVGGIAVPRSGGD